MGLVVVFARDAAAGVVVVQIGARVRFSRFQLQQVAACRSGNGLGRGLRVAGRGEIDDKRFAAGVSREVIASGAEMLGWELDELFARTIEAMQSFAPDRDTFTSN